LHLIPLRISTYYLAIGSQGFYLHSLQLLKNYRSEYIKSDRSPARALSPFCKSKLNLFSCSLFKYDDHTPPGLSLMGIIKPLGCVNLIQSIFIDEVAMTFQLVHLKTKLFICSLARNVDHTPPGLSTNICNQRHTVDGRTA
jgi:hypothetical protein